MTDTDSTDSLDIRKRKALFRAWHRGTREADLVMGNFAQRELATMSASDLSAFEMLLDESDTEIVKWVTGEMAVPEHQDSALIRRLIAEARNPATRSGS